MDNNHKANPTSGQLFIVATPIGHLSDITLRALEILKSVDCIAAEDKRNSVKLLNHFAIHTPMIAYHEHNESSMVEQIKFRLLQGEKVALISDAGTPLINDPGYALVRTLRLEGFQVTPIPGACSPIVAMSVSGLPTDQFTYFGFLPRSGQSREKLLTEIAQSPRTSVILESPKRVIKTVQALQKHCSDDREVCMARELTKLHETIVTLPISRFAHYFESQPLKGEVVLVIAPLTESEEVSDDQIRSCLMRSPFVDLAPSKRAQAVAAHLHIHKSTVYDQLLVLKNEQEE
ncbi:MAG: 16S rRNA (cytidine(1402)-2'-O)-methyltransferase [Zetaproteobacteria bacterium]|nr:16S rRNA (cytidine(1402)-2'-O)-methyltransferase [Zetaproteobacteria bacterium]